ncbi:ATP-binding protein [Caenispirillum bisanense]|uniref:ATP-binding protein n=1 Tax=Caenispirillum bisanense TaxID=414052 RepID=UPI0031E09769
MSRWRIGVAFRVLAALLIIVGLTVMLGAFALHTFADLRGQVGGLARERLPAILTAAKLDRQSALLSAQASALVLTETNGARETEMMRILDLVRTLDRLTDELADSGSPEENVATIHRLKTGFVETLDELDSQVAERLRLRRQLEETVGLVLKRGIALTDSLTPPQAWHADALIALRALQAAAIASHRAVFEREARAAGEALERLQGHLATMPAEQRAAAAAIHRDLRLWAVDDAAGVLPLRRRLLELEDAIRGTLSRNRSLADLMRAASAQLFFEGEQSARDAANAAADRFDRSQVTFAAVLAATAVVMLLTFLYLRESVILRLRALQGAMAAHIAGKAAPVPTEGSDEIGDMGRSLRFFLDVIAAREAELRESEQLFRMLALTAPFPLVMARSRDGVVLQSNQRAQELLGLGESARACDFLIDARDRAAIGEAGGAPVTDREVAIQTADGRRGWGLLSAAPAVFKGESVMLLGLVDIGARRQAEQAVRESERKYRSLLENLKNHAVFAHDLDGRFSYLSPSAEDVMGHPLEDLRADYTRFMPADELARWRERQAQLAAGVPFTRSYECSYIHSDGSVHILAVVEAAVLDEAGRVVGVEGVAHDVTAQRSYQENLRALVRELEQSNAELEDFAYVASHDLREPLRMVTSYLSLLERRHGTTLPPEAREFMDYAAEGARRMDRLILDLLDYSRVGRAERQEGPVALHDPLQTALANLKVALDEADARVTVDENLPAVHSDVSDMVRLFQNLIGNAVKYRHPERAPEIAITTTVDRGHVRLTVRDNGIGIPADQTERIFKIFQRLHPRSRYEGTGIGLAVCRKVVELHGGRIWAEPNPDGIGTSFHVSLPVARASAAA